MLQTALVSMLTGVLGFATGYHIGKPNLSQMRSLAERLVHADHILDYETRQKAQMHAARRRSVPRPDAEPSVIRRVRLSQASEPLGRRNLRKVRRKI